MIGLDTNVIVRFIAGDDPEQAALAERVIDQLSSTDPGFVGVVTMAETYWVLCRSLRHPAARALDAVEMLTETPELVVQQVAEVRRAVDRARKGADFADALIAELGRAAGCSETVTFDRQAALRAGMSLIT